MRVVNMQHYRVVLKGQEWTGPLPPCAKEAMALLENNEEIVSWLAPIDGDGTCARHVPAVRYKGNYWTISLRMSKSIYRSVRLRQGFENVQTVHGVQTLRIPLLLFNEKQRTQARFKVLFARRLACAPMSNVADATHLHTWCCAVYKYRFLSRR